ITEVRLVHPLVRAEVTEAGKLRLPTLQGWLDRLSSGSGHSRYVSDELKVSFSGLRALLMTPGGPLELDGDARLANNALVSAAISARPASLTWHGYDLRLAAAKLTANAVKTDYAVDVTLAATLNGHGLHLESADAHLAAPKVSWTSDQLSIPDLVLHLKAAGLSAGITAANPNIDLATRDVKIALGQKSEAQGTIQLQAGADFSPPLLAKQLPLLARDPRLASALTNNLEHLDLRLAARVAHHDGGTTFALEQPLTIDGAQGGRLVLAKLTLEGPLDAMTGNLDAALSGPGLPAITLRSAAFHAGKDGFSGDVALDAKFNFDMLHQAVLQARGAASFAQGSFTFSLDGCAPATLSAFHPGASDLARDIKGAICPQGPKTFTMDASGWRFSASARDAAMTVPLANIALSDGTGMLAFSGKGAAMDGKITVTAAHLGDRAAPARFEPLKAAGKVSLQDWIWQGQFSVIDGGTAPLGTASFRHVMATGRGDMTIDAPHLEFTPGKLQPRMLSALLGSFSQADGAAKFQGALSWSPSGLDSSHGTLTLQQLDFRTPLGMAHAVNATIVLSSLLPPVTAPDQHIAIAKVDWTLPLSGVAADFSFGNGTLKLERASTGFSDGNLKLAPIVVDLGKPLQLQSQADLDAISLGPLVAASNLGDKVKLEGKVSGSLPFTYGPDGIRIVNGHLHALGPGRIALDPSIWSQGGTLEVNAIQDLAYQAMENLAF
ncbi:MAG TPA: YdbH domain-containing protein, partial [Rhizomicrobium sp.]|nr:YdbH domain-containing protein [Rhizomicrobium sp.]